MKFYLAICLPYFLFFCKTSSLECNLPKCNENETSLTILDIAKELISKAKELYPNNGDDELNVTSYCGKRNKAFGYLKVAMNLITEAKEFCESSIIHIKNRQRLEWPIDCSDILENGHNTSGIYKIWPRSRTADKPLEVRCDMETDNGGWTVIQRRGNFSKQEDFYTTWENYKTGFGSLNREFWIGNDNIFALSNQGLYQIRFDLQDVAGNKRFALYDTFWIEKESSNYKLHIEKYSGDAGNSMTENHLAMFSTKDRRNDKAPSEPCTTSRHGGWWYGNCAKGNPNGLYQPGKKSDYKSIYWYFWRDLECLAATEIKIRRK